MFTPWEMYLMILKYGEVKKNIQLNTLNRLMAYYEALSEAEQVRVNAEFDNWYKAQCAITDKG